MNFIYIFCFFLIHNPNLKSSYLFLIEQNIFMLPSLLDFYREFIEKMKQEEEIKII